MIHEFAVDPAVVATWHDRNTYRFFKGKFGYGCGRVLAMFPDARWRRLVLDSFESALPGAVTGKDDARKRLEALLLSLVPEATKRGGTVADATAWLPAAEKEHERRGFHAILSTENPRSRAEVLVAQDIDDETPRWREKYGAVKKSSEDMVAMLRPLLRCAREVRLVDPYFSAATAGEDRWVKPLLRIIEALRHERGAGERATIELHTSVERARTNERERLTDTEADRVARNIVGDCKSRLASRLPAGVVLTVVVWSELADGQRFHNRYVLTDVGGVLLGTGLDAATQGRATTDDFALLTREQYVERWRQFSPNANVFKRRGQPERLIAAQAGGTRRR